MDFLVTNKAAYYTTLVCIFMLIGVYALVDTTWPDAGKTIGGLCVGWMVARMMIHLRKERQLWLKTCEEWRKMEDGDDGPYRR